MVKVSKKGVEYSMKEDMCGIIADYENAKNIPEVNRCTEYSEELGIYVLKFNVSHGLLNERYTEAKEAKDGKYVADGNKLVAVLHVNLGHNAYDKESYPLQDENIMIKTFLEKKCPEKMIGIKFGTDQHFLVRKQENMPPELIALPLDIEKRYLERLDDIRSRWFKKLLELERMQTKEQIDKIIQDGERTAAKQPRFDFSKEINRRMKTNKKVFMEERMEGYDFRGLELSGAFFLNCSLTNSNFSGCNLENALFVNCEMKDCMYYGAMLNNCRAYYGGTVLYMEDKSRKIIE